MQARFVRIHVRTHAWESTPRQRIGSLRNRKRMRRHGAISQDCSTGGRISGGIASDTYLQKAVDSRFTAVSASCAKATDEAEELSSKGFRRHERKEGRDGVVSDEFGKCESGMICCASGWLTVRVQEVPSISTMGRSLYPYECFAYLGNEPTWTMSAINMREKQKLVTV
eukprot:scaffold610410_cov33-Prasinocladus_malaysianus.AAC.2